MRNMTLGIVIIFTSSVDSSSLQRITIYIIPLFKMIVLNIEMSAWANDGREVKSTVRTSRI